MKILHLSDTTLSGSPIRTVDLINKYSPHKARHIVFHPVSRGWRKFKTDLVATKMERDAVAAMLEWPDLLVFHNRHARQEIFSHFNLKPPEKPGVIQMHSPRDSEDFTPEVESGLPIAVFCQYHPRQWPEASFLLPNALDIEAPENKREMPPLREFPVVSFSPSNANGKDWDDKGYQVVAPILKKLRAERKIRPQIITETPHDKAMEMKRSADIAVDEIVTGSYHLSGLEFLSLSVPCFANVDEQTWRAIQKVTGADNHPFLKANREDFRTKLERIVEDKSWQELGRQSRAWMEGHWSPQQVVKHHIEMYERVLA